MLDRLNTKRRVVAEVEDAFHHGVVRSKWAHLMALSEHIPSYSSDSPILERAQPFSGEKKRKMNRLCK